MQPGNPVNSTCPTPKWWGTKWTCGCDLCAECGHKRHTAVHMRPLDVEGDFVWGHEFVARKSEKKD